MGSRPLTQVWRDRLRFLGPLNSRNLVLALEGSGFLVPEWLRHKGLIGRTEGQSFINDILGADSTSDLEVHPLFDAVWYRKTYKIEKKWSRHLIFHFLIKGMKAGFDPHPEFSSEWYIRRNPDVRKSGMSSISHYLRFGSFEGRAPSQEFSLRQYLDDYPSIDTFGLDPFSYFISIGRSLGHKPVRAEKNSFELDVELVESCIDVDYYKSQNPQLGDWSPAEHYLQVGYEAAFSPNRWFNAEYYRARYADLRVTTGNLFVHFLRYGRGEGRVPSDPTDTIEFETTPSRRAAYEEMLRINAHPPGLEILSEVDRFRFLHAFLMRTNGLFDDAYYRNKYQIGNLVAPLRHYVNVGWRAGFMPNAYFDPIEYIRRNLDLTGAHLDPILHYTASGYKEGRSAGAFFDGNFYLSQNPDVASSSFPPLTHFLLYGRNEKRLPKAEVFAKPNVERRREENVLVIVTHDTEVGGAQAIARSLARWFNTSTFMDVRIVSVGSGNHHGLFKEICPLFSIARSMSEDGEEGVKVRLKQFLGENVQCVLINSVASAEFFNYWNAPVAKIAYIHELDQVIAMHPSAIETIKSECSFVFAGSAAAQENLCQKYDFDPKNCEVLYSFIDEHPLKLLSAPQKQTARKARGLDPDALIVIACGTLHWRKAPELFIEVAKIAAKMRKGYQFIWIGGGPDYEVCAALVEQSAVRLNVKFVGYQDNIEEWIRIADIFVLSSIEDTFPLVCLHAASASLPVVCFDDAGGMPEFVAQGSGVSVPFKDVAAMYRAVERYAEDAELREDVGATGRKLVDQYYTVDVAGPIVLERIRALTGRRPFVSIVIPNFNYRRYLDQRLKTIVDQSFKDREIIILDDASTDGSQESIEEWAQLQRGIRMSFNEKNSGSVFKQWAKGIVLADAQFIWMAEADDYSDPKFLEAVLIHLLDSSVSIAFGRSVPVNASGSPIGDYRSLYLDRIAPNRWDASYIVSDNDEVRSALGIANCIPNASSVVFRKRVISEERWASICSMKLCGDWLFYISVVLGGKIAFEFDAVNFHRRHEETVTRRREGDAHYFDELIKVRKAIHEDFRLDANAKLHAQKFFEGEVLRFLPNAAAGNEFAKAYRAAQDTVTRPAVLVVASDLSPGGGQMFAVRLANGLAACGRRVFLANIAKFPSHTDIIGFIEPAIQVIDVTSSDFDLRKCLVEYDIDVIHSSIWWADRFVAERIASLPDGVRWVITMHGCYESLLERPEIDGRFSELFPEMLKRVGAWVYTAEKNKAVFGVKGSPRTLVKIDNGFAPPVRGISSALLVRPRDDAFVVVIASRAIREKGWFEAVDAVKHLNAKGKRVDLILIGDGAAAEELQSNGQPEFIHFVSHVRNLEDYIAVADIGLLPSYFVGESMPLVVIEFLCQGKPVIGSDIGEIEAMLSKEGVGVAGRVLRRTKEGPVDSGELSESIAVLMSKRRNQEASRLARAIFRERFSLDRMLKAYEEIYQVGQ